MFVIERLSLSRRSTSWPHPQYCMGDCGLQEAESANLNHTHSEWQKRTKQMDGQSNKSNRQYSYDLCSRFFCLCLFSEVILYRLLSFGVHWLSVVGCPLLGSSKCTISTGIAIGGMGFVSCTEVVRLSEGPLYYQRFHCTSFSMPKCNNGHQKWDSRLH